MPLGTNFGWKVPAATADRISTLIAAGEFTNDVSDALTDGTHVAWVSSANIPVTSCNKLNVAPIADPVMTTNSDGDTVWTQYFERAVFELHPENLYPYRVLLRRLGAEELVGRGWER